MSPPATTLISVKIPERHNKFTQQMTVIVQMLCYHVQYLRSVLST